MMPYCTFARPVEQPDVPSSEAVEGFSTATRRLHDTEAGLCLGSWPQRPSGKTC